MSIAFEPIGLARTEAGTVPLSFRASDVVGTLEIQDEYREGLADIEPGQRIVAVFDFHQSPRSSRISCAKRPRTGVPCLRVKSGTWASSASALPSGPTR